MSNKVKIEKVMQLFTLFVEKKWVEIDSWQEVLKRFGKLMESLNTEQTELLLELTERYIWLSYNDYHSILRRLFISLHSSYLTNVKKLYLFPIKKLKDEKKFKSGDIVQYMLQGILPLIDEYYDLEKVPLTKFDEIENCKLQENEFIVLIDDFIGTGKTLETTLSMIQQNPTVKNNFAILTTIIQDEALQELERIKVNVLYGKLRKKGISQYYENEELNVKKKAMEQIEDNIPGVKDYRFGFEKSEGLATLIRTPNNTFPVFWKEHYYKKERKKPPFPRY